MMTDPIRALCWNNPFGVAMLHGKQETRSRPTHVRGRVLIYTAKKPYAADVVHAISGERQMLRLYEKTKEDPARELHGYAIAVARLTDCYPMREEHEDLTFVRFTPFTRRWIWHFQEVQRLEPFPWKHGKQGWLWVPETEYTNLKYI